MKVELRGDDRPSEARCKSCGAAITWVKNVKTGARSPINGGIACVVDDQVDLKKTPSHYSTCPQRDEWRGKGRRKK